MPVIVVVVVVVAVVVAAAEAADVTLGKENRRWVSRSHSRYLSQSHLLVPFFWNPMTSIDSRFLGAS